MLPDVHTLEACIVGDGRRLDNRSVPLGGRGSESGDWIGHHVTQGHQTQLHVGSLFMP
jgi:hypothetical protein